jgi:putative SOS response-associated peptidase YedK
MHNPMLAIVAPDDYASWLGEEPASLDQLKAMLRPYPPKRLAMWLVDLRAGIASLRDPLNRRGHEPSRSSGIKPPSQ